MSDWLTLVAGLCLPFVVYLLVWIVGRAWYAGRLSAIRKAFLMGGGRRKSWLRKREDGSSTSREKKTL